MPFNEADTRVNLIEPKLKAAGWTDKQITREYFYQRNHEYTEGKIILIGDKVKRGKPRRVDYLLRISESFPVAVVEAKVETESALSGLEQAKRYAKDLGLYFAYSTNGHEIIEYDFFTKKSQILSQFPWPYELWERWKGYFSDSTKKAPVVATTAELLSTGVDVPSCRNIVFMKTISFPILFKQIIGRGSRLDPATDKYWFRIIDFTGATRLFDEWDRPLGFNPQKPQGPLTASLSGRVFDLKTEESIAGASVSVRTGPNTQQGPIKTDSEGRFYFSGLPEGTLPLIVSATGYIRRQMRIETISNETVEIDVGLKPERKGTQKIKVEGLEVSIADEAIFFIEATGKQLTLAEYKDYTRAHLLKTAPTKETLREIWVDQERREKFIRALREASIHPEVLAEVLGRPDADTFDLLAHLAFGSPIRTRDEKATAFKNREQRFLKSYSERARQVILELLEKYRIGGVEQLRSEIFNVSPFKDWEEPLLSAVGSEALKTWAQL